MADRRSAMDYPEHERTYAMFVGFVKYSSIVSAVVLALMALFLL